MIIEKAFVTVIQLNQGDMNELIDKAWKAFNIDKAYPEEKIGNNAFLDWARDLCWIEEKDIIVIIKGNIQDDARRIINVLSKYWDVDFYKNVNDPDEEKNVKFILESN